MVFVRVLARGREPTKRSAAGADQVCRLGAVAYAQHLIGGSQVLLYSGLRQIKALADLRVAHALDDKTQYLPLAGREGVEVDLLFVVYQVLD